MKIIPGMMFVDDAHVANPARREIFLIISGEVSSSVYNDGSERYCVLATTHRGDVVVTGATGWYLRDYCKRLA